MGTVLAVILGLAAGALGFLPLFGGLKLSRKMVGSTTTIGQLGICVIGIMVSFVVLAVAAGVYVAVARPYSLPFVLSEGISLGVVAVSYGFRRMRGL